MITFTIDMLYEMLPSNRDAATWHPYLLDSMEYYKINTVNRVAAFMAQTAYESRDFKVVEENLRYSSAALLRTFPKYFNPVLASKCQRDPELIANVIYANRMGNGDAESGDGWTFRGRGLIQLTGRDNYEAASESICGDDTLSRSPEALSALDQPNVLVEVACWYWDENNFNKLADADDIDAITRKLTGGYATKDIRAQAYERNKEILQG